MHLGKCSETTLGNARTIMLLNQLYVSPLRETATLMVAFERVREISPQSEA